MLLGKRFHGRHSGLSWSRIRRHTPSRTAIDSRGSRSRQLRDGRVNISGTGDSDTWKRG